MPGLVQSGHKRPSIVLSDDDDDDQSGYASSVSVASKRARHVRNASHNPAPTNSNHARNRMPTSSAKAVEAEFPAGSLLRVKLRNFVTYTAAEFHLGPSLNMIIGPNGTGKSTLVCAICLGLGWGSEHLGRAKDIGLFVKNGSNEAEIEIELAAGPDMDRNPVVRRFIRKEDNKSIFWINGKQVPKNAVLALCKKFSIQIDNLCQFLPQDRVVEFSKMKPEARLKETLRAAAPTQMVEWYDQLKELRVEEKGLETEQQNEQKHLEKLERAQAAAQDDVDRFQQREGLVKKARCLAMVKPIIELRERKENVKRAKEDLTAAKRELDQLNADVEPVQRAQVEAGTYKAQIEEVVKTRRNRMDMIKAQADQIFVKIEKEKQVNADTIAEVAGEVKSKKDRERDIARVNGDIQRLDRQRQEEPVEYDATGFDQRRAELRSELSAANTALEECKAEYEDQKRQVVELMQESKRIGHQREQLNTQVGKQVSVLTAVSRDTAKAWDWFKANREQLSLKGQVCGPAILECSVRDPHYAQAVESQLRKGDLVAITCTNADDQKLLSNHFLGRGSGGLGLHDVHLRTSPKPLSAYPPPIASTGLADLGFEGYIIDYLNGPDAVLAMLCDNSRLNRIAYAPRSLSDEQHAAVSSSSIQKWVSGKDIYQITTRREYGVSSTSVTQLKPARCFVDQPANTEEMRELDEALRRNQHSSGELKENINNTKQQIIEADQKVKDLRRARDELQTEQDRFKKARAEWDALPNKIGRQQEKLDELLQENAQTKDRIRAIQAKARQASLKAANLTLEYTKATTQIRTFYESLVEAEVRLIEANSEMRALTRENEGILQKLQRKKIDVEQLKQGLDRLKAEYKRLLARTQQHLNDLDDEEKAMMNEYQHIPTIEALDQEAAAVNARLEMMAEGNHGVLRAFEKRKEEIAQAQEKLDEYTTSLDATKEKITGIRTQWEPQLDALISKISDAFAHNFQQIACAGEVRVYKDEEDFNNWSIQISVRFREGEQLSVLDDNRQSGGERAVSTVFYLMALQDLAQSPFRVVDEINQGMDPRNERKVHERMVDIACQEHTSQYFLVTPKLLTGLKFHPKMKVHIINSGEHVPDAKDAKTWDLRGLAKIALRTRKGIEVS